MAGKRVISCCPHTVERHAYNGCADCGCGVTWSEHPDRALDTSRDGVAANARRGKKSPAQLDREIAAMVTVGLPIAARFAARQKVMVSGDVGTRTLDKIPDGEIVKVFEDYGQSHVSVMRDNGQLRTVLRGCLTVA